MADYRKEADKLGEKWKKGVPIAFVPMARAPLARSLEKLGGRPKLRMAKAKAGPVVDDNGNLIYDVDFGVIDDPMALEAKLCVLPGVVTTGIFAGMCSKAYFGQEDGSITQRN